MSHGGPDEDHFQGGCAYRNRGVGRLCLRLYRHRVIIWRRKG
jgi:hypothetical protein